MLSKLYIDSDGFTLFELIIIILIVSVIAVIALPRINISNFREQGFVQQSLASIRYAQKQAIASGCHVQVDISASGCNLNMQASAPNCNATTLTNPITGSPDFCLDSDAPAGSTFAAPFTFDNIGRPSGGAKQFVLGGRTIRVEAETGYTHEP